MKKTLRRLAAALAATGLIAALAGCAAQPGTGPSPDDAPITIGLTYTPNVQFAAFYLAEQRGWFDEAGVNVELRHHGQSEDLFGALQSGAEDLVYAGGDEIVQARSAGVDVTSIGQLYTSYPAALIVPADSPIHSAADLRGRTIGTPGPYGQTYSALLAILAGAGLTQQDLTVEPIGFTQQVALTSGKVDGVMGYSNNDAVQLAESGFPVRVIPAFPAGSERLVGPSIGASSATIAARPEQLSAILSALARATDELIANPDAAVEASAAFIPTLSGDQATANARATLDATIPLLGQAGGRRFEQDPSTWSSMTAFMSEQGLLAGPAPALEECFTNALLSAA